ncbi:glutathione synthase/RimK-type ligase-like ATP-grasp enzyme [Pontibacter ummariensis]|uniref:Glutathione synthase/RimK-type ligase, ATP-grasp superfamily n=1 Tax=Pontibacter ummariensis TaxID=1610492 RepID=A0A239BV05_9BACT|nr:RimK family protein [Pontibacter ummariensis]PRY15615.1 glutathione synthase/RimK-type ligase-like ATP-grasp enzyme [Pontibacter ummariensis]SNS11499.1 Glutathione synthase/RimK-type ligase, ATP-grasp superfamily [Pontibacter ummariensis]
MRKIVVVDYPKDWGLAIEDIEVVEAQAYLTDAAYTDIRNARIFNLCRSYKYQSAGYYVSLLAEARGHKPIPSVTTMQDLKSPTIVRAITVEINDLIQKSLANIRSSNFTLSIYFGQNVAQKYEKLCKQLHDLFQAPLLRAQFVQKEEWVLQSISPIPVNEVPQSHWKYMVDFAKAYFARHRFSGARINRKIYDLAILVDPAEKEPPSDRKAIQYFLEAAEAQGFYAELITKEDYRRLPEFDALFIRETTSVNHHTYRFARKAHADGLAVIDDPVSILRCTNKVYLAELLTKAKVPIPKTMIIHKDNRKEVEEVLGLPCVLKKPDSSFSQGVVKAKCRESLKEELDKMLADSELIIGQEFSPTDFDWRIGVLDKQPLYACKYYMAKGHWQIYNWEGKKQDTAGDVETVPFEQVPFTVLHTALKAANLIGNGLYGVDLKEIDGKAYVIEVNDNPSIEAGCEDKVLKRELYATVIKSIKQRIDNHKNGRVNE